MSSRTRFHVILGLIFVGGLFLAVFPWLWLVEATHVTWLGSRFDEVVHKMGDALMIAPILAIAVDQAAKQELLKEFAKDVSSHIIGRQLPEPMREYIRDYLDVEFLRSTWDVTYEISPWKRKDGSIENGHVQLATKSVFTMHNLTPKDRAYTFRYEVEDSWFPRIGDTRLTHASARPLVGGGGFDWPEDKLKPPLLKHDKGVQWFEEDVTIGAGKRWHFVAESVECFRDSSTCPPFNAYYAVEAMTIAVRYPKSMFTVSLTLTFGDVADAAEVPTETADETTWRLTKPMLPGQGFIVTWQRKPAPAPGGHGTSHGHGHGGRRTD